eukprot:726335-Rhodomonas_salina.1
MSGLTWTLAGRFGGVNCRGSGTFGLRQDQVCPLVSAYYWRARPVREATKPLLCGTEIVQSAVLMSCDVRY